MAESDRKRKIVDSIARSYEKKCEETIGDALEALYIFGSYALGQINLDITDINYSLILKEGISPDVFLKHAEVAREVIDEFKDVATIIAEFRPSRWIYPSRYLCPAEKRADFDVTVCLNYSHIEDMHWGWLFEGVLKTRKLIFGRDVLAEIRQQPTTTEIVKANFPRAFRSITTPIERAPFQYHLPEDSRLLLHEAYKTAQMAAIGYGVTVALNEKEMEEKKWLEFVSDKHKLVQFYRERYDEASARNIELLLEVRDNWRKHKDDPEMAIRMYRAAIDICTGIKAKYKERFQG